MQQLSDSENLASETHYAVLGLLARQFHPAGKKASRCGPQDMGYFILPDLHAQNIELDPLPTGLTQDRLAVRVQLIYGLVD